MSKRLFGKDISKATEVLPFFRGPLGSTLVSLIEERVAELDSKIKTNSILHVRGTEFAKELCLEQLGRLAELQELLKEIKTLTGAK